MTSLNILHASDLHISVHKRLRSPLDKFRDLEHPWDVSAHGIGEKIPIAEAFITAWWERMAASSYDPELLEALAEFIYEYARVKLDHDGQPVTEEGADKLDAVVLTGDLATTGSTDDIDRVAKFLRSPWNPKYPHKSASDDYRGASLAAVKVPILCLPGNHDRYIPTREIFQKKYPILFRPGGRNFDSKVDDYWHKPVHEIEISTERSDTKRLRVVVLAADFTLENLHDHEGLFGWLAQGRAYSDKRAKLVSRTNELRKQADDDEVLCILWAMHFPPAYPGYPTYGKLLGDTKVLSAANQVGVHAILAGHTHKHLTYRSPEWAFFIFCAGTATQYEPQPSPGSPISSVKADNYFQVINVNLDEIGRLRISNKHYGYSEDGDGSVPRLMRWTELNSLATS